jgi:hypothetical protein
MRRSTNEPSIGDNIENDPRFASEVLAIQFQAIEQDRYDKEHSFICRYWGFFSTLGMLMAFGPIFAMVALAGRIDFGSDSGLRLLSALMATSVFGIFLILFCFARPGSKNWSAALGKVLLMVGGFMAVASLILIGLDALAGN